MSRSGRLLSSAFIVCIVVFVFILGPQPSVVLLCTNYYILVQKSWTSVASMSLIHIPTTQLINLMTVTVYLGVNYALIFMMLSSLMVTLIRDPGPVKPLEELENEQEDLNDTSADHRDSEDISLAEALMSREEDHRAEAFSLTPVKSTGESRWCRKVRHRLIMNIDFLFYDIAYLCAIRKNIYSTFFCCRSVGLPNPKGHIIAASVTVAYLKWVSIISSCDPQSSSIYFSWFLDHHCPWLANRCVVRT